MKYGKSTAIGPFQNKIDKKKMETKIQAKPYVKFEELKERNIRNNETNNTMPRRASSFVKGGNFMVSMPSLTILQEINVDKSFIFLFSDKN